MASARLPARRPTSATEQLARGETTIQSDLYSLGLILYEAFTGQPAGPQVRLDRGVEWGEERRVVVASPGRTGGRLRSGCRTRDPALPPKRPPPPSRFRAGCGRCTNCTGNPVARIAAARITTGKQAVLGRSSVREHEHQPRERVSQRRHHRGPDHGPLAAKRPARAGTHIVVRLQGEERRRPGIWAVAQRGDGARRQHPASRATGCA